VVDVCTVAADLRLHGIPPAWLGGICITPRLPQNAVELSDVDCDTLKSDPSHLSDAEDLQEHEPLIASSSSSTLQYRRNSKQASQDRHSFIRPQEISVLQSIMEKVKGSKLSYYADKLAVEAEPGLSNTQLFVCFKEI